MDAHIVAREIGLLRSFAQNNLQRGSKVHSLVVELVQRLENDTQPGSDSAGSYRLQVRVNQSSLPSTTLFVDKSTTIQQLKVAIESSYSGGMTLGRLLVPRTGRTWSQFSGGMTLEKCEIIDGDIVLVDVAAAASIQRSQVPSTTVLSQSQAESGSPSVLATGLERISVSSISAPIESPFFMLVLAVHCFLLDEQFVCVAEQENAVPGFAAPVRGTLHYNAIRDPRSQSKLIFSLSYHLALKSSQGHICVFVVVYTSLILRLSALLVCTKSLTLILYRMPPPHRGSSICSRTSKLGRRPAEYHTFV